MYWLLYIVGFVFWLLVYLPGILWQCARLVGVVIVGELRVASNRVLAFLIGSLAKWLADVVKIIRFLNRLFGLEK